MTEPNDTVLADLGLSPTAERLTLELTYRLVYGWGRSTVEIWEDMRREVERIIAERAE